MEKIIKLVPRVFISLFVFVFLSGCTSVGRVPLDVSQRQTIHHLNEILSTDQKHLEVEQMDPSTAPSYPAAPGIAGLVVSAAFNSMVAHNENMRAEKSIASLRKSLANENYNQLMMDQTAQELRTIKWFHLDNNSVMNKLTPAQKTTIANNAKALGDTMIYVDFTYKLSKLILDTLIVTANVEVYKKASPQAVLIYQNDFEYIDRLEPHKPNQNSTHLWAENNAARARLSMHLAIQLLSKAIARDIQDSEHRPNKKQPTNVWYANTLGGEYAGYFEGKIGDKSIVRDSSGGIVIVNDRLVRRKHNWRE